MCVTNEQAQAALQVLLTYIQEQPTIPVRGDDAPPECIEVGEVRHWCYQLLRQANAHGYGGCRLCMS